MSSHVTLLLLVILLLVLVIAVGFFIWHSMHSASARSSKQGGNTGKIRIRNLAPEKTCIFGRAVLESDIDFKRKACSRSAQAVV